MQKSLSNTLPNKLHKQIIKVCHFLEMPLHFNRKDPKTFTNYQRVALIILYKRSKKSLVDFISELYESLWPKWLGLKEIPGSSILHDWLKLFEMPVIKALHEATLKEIRPRLMAIDATGIDSWQRSRHYERRIGETIMPYAKLDAIIDTDSMLICDHVLRLKPRHDALIAKQILKRIKFKNVKILGDKGYDSEPLHKLVVGKGNKLYAPVRESGRKVPRGFWRQRCLESDEDYSTRNRVESCFHAFKYRILSSLRSRINYMKKREMAWAVILYNLVTISKSIKILLRILIAYSG